VSKHETRIRDSILFLMIVLSGGGAVKRGPNNAAKKE